MKRNRAVILLIAILALPGARAAQSAWVHYDNTHSLVYSNDALGNRLPDFSSAGYEGGGVALPASIAVKTNLSALAGDNTAAIQGALNYVSGLTPDTNGFRGAVLLNPGSYQIAGTLAISAGGVVLRGSGNDWNTGTVLVVTGTARNVLTLSGSGSWTQTGATYAIADPYVPLGATRFHVSTGQTPIVWGTNTTLSGDTDVFTNGTLQYAYNWTGTNATVNTVTFAGATNASAGTDVKITGIGSIYHAYTSTTAPFANLSAAYRSILVGGIYGSAVTASVTLNNLTVGRVYAVQIWVCDPRASGAEAGRTETLTGSNLVTLAYNVPPIPGGLGQFAIGVFTANAASLTLALAATNSSGSTQLNALLVSDVTTSGYQPVNPPPTLAPAPFSVGQTILVQRPWTTSWIDAIGMDLLTNPWSAGTGLQLERQVTAVAGNLITVDAPLVNPIESVWTTGLVCQVTDSGRIQQSGLENFCAVGQISDYPSNILTGVFADLANLKNCWARNIALSGWGNGITLDSGTKWCTVQDCTYTNPATGTSSAAPAAWTIVGAQSLFQRCNSDGGYYHIMVTQASTPGPNVFLNFNCTGTHYNGGPHQRWAAGVLHDCIVMAADSQGGYTPYLAVNNRGNDGSGQGWGAGFSVMYNCQTPQFQLEQPATTTNQYNWTIGGLGSARSYSDPGIYDAFNSLVNPHSLYLEQLRERLGGAAVENIGYPLFTIASTPAAQTIYAGMTATFTVNLGDPALMSNVVSLAVSGLPANAAAAFSTNLVTGAGSATLTVVTSNGLAPGSYALTVSGANAGVTHAAQISVGVSQPPQLSAPTVTGQQLIFRGTNGLAGRPYLVLSSTNLAWPFPRWTVIATNTFSGGSFAVTNSFNSTAPQTYYMLAAP